MRCLALAQAWRKLGGAAEFASYCKFPALRRRALAAKARFIPLARKSGEGAAVFKDADWVAADGYHFDEGYHRALRAAGPRLLVVDDYAHLPRYRADVLLNQNFGASDLGYLCDPETLTLFGPRFALIRPEFLPWRRTREVPAAARKVLVTFGGADPANATAKVLEALDAPGARGLQATVVVGAANPNFAALKKAASRLGDRVRLVRDASNMPELMAWADVAVAAGGSTCWELAFLGVPALILTLADNQRSVAAGLDRAGAAVSLGEASAAEPGSISRALAGLCADREKRRGMSDAGRGFVDGHGPRRVAAILRAISSPRIDPAELELRAAGAGHSFEIWRIANDPAVRANSFARAPIPWEGHSTWFREQLSRPDARFWVLELGGAVAAQVRYVRADADSAEVHFSVAAAFRGKGLGTLALEKTAALARSELRVERIRGVVLKPNAASESAFLKAGYARRADERQKGRDCSVFEFELASRSARR